MVHSLELLLDPASEAAVVAQWRRLLDAGLPSQGRHEGASNRPHVTLAALPAMDPLHEPALAAAFREVLPLEVRLPGAAVFGAGPYVVVRLVAADVALLQLHRAVAGLLGVAPGTHLSPGRWTPHVTLARRVAAEQLGDVLDLVAADGGADVRLVQARRWDSDERRVWSVG